MQRVSIGWIGLVGTLVLVVSSEASVAAAPRKPAPAAPIVTLTWRSEMPEDNDSIEQHVALRVTQRSVSKTYKLQRMMGGVDPINQSFCRGTDAQYPLAKSEVAKITFYEGGARGYYAKRSKRGSTLQLFSFAMTDGLCDPSDGCHQPNDRSILKITIPANATIVEQMEERPAGASEFKPFNCNPPPAR